MKKTFCFLSLFCGAVTLLDIDYSLKYEKVMLETTKMGRHIGTERNPIQLALMKSVGMKGAMIVRGSVAVFTIAILALLLRYRRIVAVSCISVWSVQQLSLLFVLLS